MNLESVRSLIKNIPDNKKGEVRLESYEATCERLSALEERIGKNVKETIEKEHWPISFIDIEHIVKIKICEALEKQIPKRARIEYGYLGSKSPEAFCAICGGTLGNSYAAKSLKHCSDCGQALDWSESE